MGKRSCYTEIYYINGHYQVNVNREHSDYPEELLRLAQRNVSGIGAIDRYAITVWHPSNESDVLVWHYERS